MWKGWSSALFWIDSFLHINNNSMLQHVHQIAPVATHGSHTCSKKCTSPQAHLVAAFESPK